MVLDFVNTVSGRPQYARDDLAAPGDLLDWAIAAGRVHDRLPVLDEAPTRGQWRATIELRERLYALLAPVIAGAGPMPSDEQWLLQHLGNATRVASLKRTEHGFELAWTAGDSVGLQHALVAEAATLMCSASIDRVKACDGCGWLFLDTSRAGVRRWCAMSMCGSRHKMRRYHQRQVVGAGR